MNIFTKKSFIKKIAILCLFLVLFNCTGINQVQAANEDSFWGGKLLGATVSLVVSVADSVYSVINRAIMGDSYFDTLQDVATTTDFWGKVARVVVGAIRHSSRNFDRFSYSGHSCFGDRKCYSYMGKTIGRRFN